MDRKLELKHLAPYLPYELKYKGTYGGISKLRELEYCRPFNNELEKFTDEIGVDGYLIQYIKPILHPLSDIKNYVDEDAYEIQEFREYVGIGDWCAIYDNAIEYICDNINNLQDLNIGALPSAFVEWMATKHLDFNKLIPDGLAIDKNTLNR